MYPMLAEPLEMPIDEDQWKVLILGLLCSGSAGVDERWGGELREPRLEGWTGVGL